MAVTNQLTTIHSCEQATDAVTGCVLSGADSTFGNATGEYVEGSNGYIFDLDIETHNCTFTPSSSLNLSSQVVWLWMRFLTESYLDTWPNGGVKCRLNDGTNWSEWYLGGSGRWGSAYVRIPFYTGSTPDAVSGTLNLSTVTSIVYYFTGTVKSKLPQNVFIDYLQYGAVGSGIEITGGGVGTEEAFSDVYGDDVTAAAGMIDYIDGVYFMNGPWNYGDASGALNCYFEDTNQIIVSKDHYRSFTTANRGTAESLVASNHYQFNVQNDTGTCNFQLGESAGGRGASGCTFKTGGNRKIVFDFDDTDIDILKLYGCTFIDCSTFTFPTAISGSEVYDSVWNSCGEVDVSTFKFRYCNWVNATGNAIQLDSTSFDVQQCNFISPTTAGVELTVAGPYNFVGMYFIGTSGSGPYDVNNTYGSAITVNNDADSNGTYYTGSTVTFVATKNVNIAVKDEGGSAIEDAKVTIWRATRTSYTSDTGNNAGDSDFVVNEVVDTDQSQTGHILVWNKANNYQVSLRYASWTSKTFTLPSEVTGSVTTAGGSGEEGTQLIDSAAAGWSGVEVGDPIRNTTDGSWAQVAEIVSATELKTTWLQGGTDNEWDLSDSYSINRLPVNFTDDDDDVEIPLYHDQTNASGDIATYAHNYAAGAMSITIDVSQRDTTPKYITRNSVPGSIGASGHSSIITLQEDVVDV